MEFKKNFQEFIDRNVESAFELIFGNAHGYAMTNSGDITPEQQAKLDSLKEDLKSLVMTQVIQNLDEKQRKYYGIQEEPVAEATQEETPQPRIWKVPVCRTGFGSRTINVIATTEAEAIEKAIDEAGNHEFSENDAEYTAPDGAF